MAAQIRMVNCSAGIGTVTPQALSKVVTTTDGHRWLFISPMIMISWTDSATHVGILAHMYNKQHIIVSCMSRFVVHTTDQFEGKNRRSFGTTTLVRKDVTGLLPGIQRARNSCFLLLLRGVLPGNSDNGLDTASTYNIRPRSTIPNGAHEWKDSLQTPQNDVIPGGGVSRTFLGLLANTPRRS